MFDFLKKSSNNQIMKEDIYNKTTNQIIEEIHESFYTEVDRLLASAKIAKSLDTDKQDLIDKCARLKALGFTNTKEVIEAEKEIARLQTLELENKNKTTLIEAINYFSFKYPNYKFITEDSVKKICSKYGLIYGSSSLYIGTIPDLNLKHIEDFKIDNDDNCHLKQDIYHSQYRGRVVQKSDFFSGKKNRLEQEERAKKLKDDPISFMIEPINIHHSSIYYSFVKKMCELEIAAPIKDFDTKNMEVNDFKLEVKPMEYDPIVLKPVFHGGQKHYLIVTAWGLEASDELVVNQKMN